MTQATPASPTVRIAVAGVGYWGINHVRAFAAARGATLAAVVDPDDAARERALRLSPAARSLTRLDDALADPAIRQKLAGLGQEPFPETMGSPEALGAFHKAEVEKWFPIVKAANIKVE